MLATKLPRCAVLMAAYNGVPYLPQQLESILSQKNIDLTLFISVDQSTDGTEEWVSHYASQHDQVVVLPLGLKFGGAAKNFFRLIRDVNFEAFDYIAFADQDDIWNDDKLSSAYQQIKASGCDAYSSNVLAYWPDGKEFALDKMQKQQAYDYFFEAAGPGCTYVLSRELMVAIQQNIQLHWEAIQHVSLHDWYCYAYARFHGYRWCMDPTLTMRYRQHNSNEFGVNKGWKAIKARWKKISEGWWFSQARLIAHLIGADKNPFVVKWSKNKSSSFLQLALKANQCRRRKSHQLFFMVVCLYFACRISRS